VLLEALWRQALDSGYYSACTALKTQTQALELAANNIANVNTSGYRGQIPSFQSMLITGSSGSTANGWSKLINEFSVLNGSRLDFRQGNLESTGNPLDLAIEGARLPCRANQGRNTLHAQREL
jgi:flagellar basal-body rod protein FlgF